MTSVTYCLPTNIAPGLMTWQLLLSVIVVKEFEEEVLAMHCMSSNQKKSSVHCYILGQYNHAYWTVYQRAKKDYHQDLCFLFSSSFATTSWIVWQALEYTEKISPLWRENAACCYALRCYIITTTTMHDNHAHSYDDTSHTSNMRHPIDHRHHYWGGQLSQAWILTLPA